MNDNAMPAPQDRLHNSGARPREVFRCPRIGNETELDLFKALCSCKEMPRDVLLLAMHGITWADAGVRRGEQPGRKSNPSIQPAGVVAIASTRLRAVGALTGNHLVEPTAENAVVLLGQVVRLVVAKGWHREALGLASHRLLHLKSWRGLERIASECLPLEQVALTVQPSPCIRRP
jgi:hypothetical protein